MLGFALSYDCVGRQMCRIRNACHIMLHVHTYSKYEHTVRKVVVPEHKSVGDDRQNDDGGCFGTFA